MSRREEGHIRQRSAGSYEVRYSLGIEAATGKRKMATFTVRGTLSEAKKELRRRLHSVDEGTHVDPSRVTVAEFLERWLADWATVNVNPKTGERYGQLIRKHALPFIGKLPMQKLRQIGRASCRERV